MLRAYMIAILSALIVASPCSYGQTNDGNDKPAAPTSSYDDAKDKKDNRVVNNLTLLPIRDHTLRMRLWKELVRLAQPDTLRVPANRSTTEALQERCGSAPTDLQQILAKLNLGRNQWISSEPRELTFIPCPFWAFQKYNHPETKIPIRKGQSIDKVLPLYMGIAGPENKKKIEDPQRLLNANGVAIADGTLLIDYVTKPVSFRLRDEIKENSDQVVRDLTEKFRDNMPGDIANDNNANGGVSYYLVAQDGPQGEVCDSCCKGPDSDDQWPFDMQQIANKYADMMGNVKEVDTVVLVADTGLDLSDPTVNRTLWTDTRVVRKLEKKYGENPHGTNLSDLKRGGIDISPEYPFAVHGTEVVKTLTGGPSVPETFPAPFKVAIAKVIRDSGPFDINADAVANMFMYASYIDARRKVLNFSVVIGSEEASLIRGMDSANFLVVSAAGNKNRLVQEARICPPCLNAYPDRLIVVGAHDWANQRADFSNYGPTVDLLAPGCAIPFRGQDGNIQSLSGTSFAAPFVSFTAALLASYGMLPGEIKSRILLTVDFDENFVDITRSAGRLNIVNALSIRDDILVVKVKNDSEKAIEKLVSLYGELDPYQNWFCKKEHLPEGGVSAAPHTVGRVVPRYRHGTSKALVSWPSSSGALDEIVCASLEGVVKFREKEAKPGSDYVAYELSDVISIIPKLPQIR